MVQENRNQEIEVLRTQDLTNKSSFGKVGFDIIINQIILKIYYRSLASEYEDIIIGVRTLLT